MRLRVAVIPLLLAASVWGAAAPSRNLKRESDALAVRVVSALAAARVSVSAAQLQFLTSANQENSPALILSQLQKWQDDSALASFRCKQAGQCVPFFVVVRWPGEQRRDEALSAAEIAARTPVQKKRDFLVRAGQTATLVIEGKQMRVTTPIICLESGALGQKIRVSSIDRKRISTAEVVESGVLRRSL